jgi:NADH:ubiquinone oxidoreductase subunit K
MSCRQGNITQIFVVNLIKLFQKNKMLKIYFFYNILSYDTSMYIYLGPMLFFLSLFGLLCVKNYILLLLLIDLGMLSACYNFTLGSIILNEPLGQIYTLLMLVLITVDTAIGLSLVLVMDRLFKNTSLNLISRI